MIKSIGLYTKAEMSLFVGNISRNVKSRDLEEEFNRFGKCTLNSKVGQIGRVGRAAMRSSSMRTKRTLKRP